MNAIRKILKVLDRRDKLKYGLLLIGILILGFLEVVGIASVLPFMELLSKPDAIKQSSWLTYAYNAFQFESTKSFLIAAGAFVITTIALSNIIAIAATYAQYKISWGMAHRMSTRLLRIYAKKPYSYFLMQNTAEIRAYLITEIAALTSGVFIPIIEFISRSIICIIIFSLLIFLSPQITFTMLVLLGGSYLIIYISRQKLLKNLGNQRINANANRQKFMEEMLTGIKTVKIYGVLDFFHKRYAEASKDVCRIHPNVQMIYATPKYLLEILAFGGIMSMTMYLYIVEGDLARALPRLSVYAVAGYRLLPSLQRAFAAASKVRHNLPSLDKLYDDLLLTLSPQSQTETTNSRLSFDKKIVIDNIAFKYESAEHPVLKNLNLEIDKGSVVAFVGSTGSGKTTLIDIITGLLTPSTGKLIVDDVVINESNVESWQNNIAYVPQEVFLYDDTVKANIVLGIAEDDIDYKKLEEVIEMADIADFIHHELKDGLETSIGERGVRISGGQRQRIGLARALYTNPSLIVLDEATSALDSITERGIIESLNKLPDDITIVIIAHRISTVKYADNIFVLDHGKIISNGIYNELIENNGKFKKMVELS